MRKNTCIKYFSILFVLLLFFSAVSCGDDDNDSSPGCGDEDDDDSNYDDDDTTDDDQADDDDTGDDDDDDNDTYDDSALSEFIEGKMSDAHIPGMGVAVVKDGETKWSKGFGWAHINNQIPATADTIFMLASVSKAVTAVALMQVYDDGFFELDDPVNDYLDFSVTNPNVKADDITFRHLLTHASSIRDNWSVLSALYVNGDSPIALGTFLSNYLAPGGSYYFESFNYYGYAPGTQWNYSNVGAATCGYLVEAITETAFDRHCEDEIFSPLGMGTASWFLAGVDQDQLAMPYEYRAALNKYVPYGHYGYPDYPDGQLRTSANDLAKFLAMFSEGGQSILDSGTVQKMRTVQDPELDGTQGLIWYYKTLGGNLLLGHNGGDSGVGAEMFYRTKDGTGFVVLFNTDWSNSVENAVDEIEKKLLDEADLM